MLLRKGDSPCHSPTIPFLLRELRNSPIGGHQGTLKTYQRLAQEVYWRGMKARAQTYVAECSTCQQVKYLTLAQARLLQALPILDKVWDDIAMSFIEGLPKSVVYDTIMVVVDWLSKYAHFILLKHPFTAHSIVVVFMKEVVRLHNYPRSIVSNKDNLPILPIPPCWLQT